MGLLDSLTYDPQMALGMGLLGASGPSRMPVGMGQALASGWGQMQETAKEKQKRDLMAQQAEMQKMQMGEMQSRNQALQAFRSKLPPELQSQFDIDPKGFMSLLNKQQEEYTLTPGAARFKGDKKLAEVPMKPNEAPLPWYVRQGPDGKTVIDPAYADFEKTKAGLARPATPYFQFLPTPDGYAVGDARSGKIAPPGAAGPTVIRSQDSPKLQGEIAGAKEAATTKAGSEAKREMTMSGVSGLIDQAESILSNKSKPPTQSGIGAAADKAASLIGVTPSGAAEADQLRVLGGNLVSKMPRMEGPQSNYDVQNYKEMAADVGNPMLPIKRRLAALSTLRGIVSKYDKGASAEVAGDDPPAGAVRRKK